MTMLDVDEIHERVRTHRLNDRGSITIGETDRYLIEIIPMIFNDRLVLTPKSCPIVWDYGWCYDKGAAAVLAAFAWDPGTEGEPRGWKKRVHDKPRVIEP